MRRRASNSAAAVRDRLGWRKGEGDQREWWVPAETWKAEFCDGLDPTSSPGRWCRAECSGDRTGRT